MKTQDANEISRRVHRQQVSAAFVGRHARWGAAVLATLTSLACGSRLDGGNTGSETHWLQACDADADCGEYSCLCGICSISCDNDGQCDEGGDRGGQCVDPDGLEDQSDCGDGLPARICVAESAALQNPDAGGAPDTSGTPQSSSLASDTSAAATETTTSAPTSSSPPEPPFGTAICDGSDDLRLWTQTTVGGLSGPAQMFAGAYGWAYLAIDGKCHYWASSSGQLFTGTITDEAVLRDYEASYFGKLARFADFDAGPTCPDAPAAFLADPSALLRINTCGAEDPPAGYRETWDAVTALTNALVLQGERSAGPLRIAFASAQSASQNWTLDLNPSEWVPETLDYATLTAPDGGIWLNAGETADALRTADAGDYTYEGASGPSYVSLFVRDEPPPKVIAALVGGLANSVRPDSLGSACDDALDCSGRLVCLASSDPAEDQGTCSLCVSPGETAEGRACQSNDDCCGGLVCCVDCGDESGTCIAEPDPCETCLANGGTWNLSYGTCSAEQCEPDVACYSQTCPGLCAPDNCEGCGRAEECWAAGSTCQWDELAGCVAPAPAP